jgi:hypothetical protein
MGIHVNSIHPMSVPGKNMRFSNISNWRAIHKLMDVLTGTATWALIGAAAGSLYGALCGSILGILHQDITKVFYYAMIFGVTGTATGAFLGAVTKLLAGKTRISASPGEPSSFEKTEMRDKMTSPTHQPTTSPQDRQQGILCQEQQR